MVDFTNPITSKVFLKNFVEFAPVYANAQAAYTAWAAAMGYGFPGSDSVGLSNSYYPGFGGFSPNVPFGFNVPYDYPVDGGYMHEFVVGAGGLYFYASRPSDDDTTTRTYTQADVLVGAVGLRNLITPNLKALFTIGAQYTDASTVLYSVDTTNTKLRFGTSAIVPETSLIGYIVTQVNGTATNSMYTAFRMTPGKLEMYITANASDIPATYATTFAGIVSNESTNARVSATVLKSAWTGTTAFKSDDLSVLHPILKQNLQATGNPLPGWKASTVLADDVYAESALKVARHQTLIQGVGASETPVVAYGKALTDILTTVASTNTRLSYTTSAVDTAELRSALLLAYPLTLTGGVQIASALTGTYSLVVMGNLGLLGTASPRLSYTRVLVDVIKLHDDLRRFFSGSLTETIGVHDASAYKYRPLPVVADTVALASTLTQTMVFRVTASDTLKMSDVALLKMIFSGAVVDGIEVTAAYISPGDNFTTWTLNTRTAAVSEYKNYNFNSFAQIGNRYLGASSTGLYDLTGNTDAGAAIIANLKSGMAQFGGLKFSSFKAAYVGLRGTGDFILRLITGEGLTYDYALKAQNMSATKIDLGKGLRARFFAFQLLSTGADFDLDGVEFVPLVAQRRV